jgi:hypothetical protein
VAEPASAPTKAQPATREDLGSRLALSRREWRRLAVLGSPTFGMATATTIVSSFLPVVARGYAASSVAVG